MSETKTTDGSDLMRQFLPNSPFAAALDVRLADIEPGRAVLEMPFSDARTTMGDTVHGGAIATLADCCAMCTAWAGAPIPESLRGATVSLTVTYADAARGEDLVAEGTLVKRGSSLSTVDITIRTAKGRTVAKALASYKVG